MSASLVFGWVVEDVVDGWEDTPDKAWLLNIRSGGGLGASSPPRWLHRPPTTSPEEGDTSVVIRGPLGCARGRTTPSL